MKRKVKPLEDLELEEGILRESRRRYRVSSKGQVSISSQNHSKSHLLAQSRYSKSEKGKLASKRYHLSEGGKRRLALRKVKEARAKEFLQRESLGLCGLCGQEGHKSELHLRS